MNYQNHGTSSSAPVELPVKRKRGRPRKDEGLLHVDSISLSDSGNKRNRQTVAATTNVVTSGNMVGQMVTGVIEGSFDAGYLLNVKVGDSNTPLRGVVFLPGRYVPVNASNDVAPQAKMSERNEMQRIPNPNPADSGEQSKEDNNKQSVESNKDVSHRIPDLPPANQLHDSSPASTGMFLVGDLQDKAPTQKGSETGLDKVKVTGNAQEFFGPSKLILEGPKESILPMPINEMGVYGDGRSGCFGRKQMNTMIGDDRFHMSGGAFGVGAGSDPYTTAMSNLSAIMFQPDSGMFEPKPASEDSILRGMVEVQPQVFTSASSNANIVDCSAKDPIPPAEL